MHCREEEEMHQDRGVVQDTVSVVDNNISTRLGNNGLKRKVVWLNRDGILIFFFQPQLIRPRREVGTSMWPPIILCSKHSRTYLGNWGWKLCVELFGFSRVKKLKEETVMGFWTC